MTQGRTYRVLKAVGKGGFGTVYRADMLGPNGFTKPVALKVLNPEMAEQEGIAERLRDEARLLSLLQHRSIVWVDGLLQLNGRWTVVMEFVDGVNLRQLLKGGTVPVGCALDIVQQVAGAFHYAYEMPARNGQPLHLLHRDVKPSNIHLTPSGDVKVLDFGVARADFQTRESITRSLFFGSLEYMSPERLDSIDTHAGDIYALGAVLYELIVGEKVGRSSGNRERHNTHLKSRLGDLWEITEDRELYKLLADCMAYDDALRPAARILERRIRSIRGRFGEPWLSEWAEERVPAIAAQAIPFEDELSGSLLAEQPGHALEGALPPIPDRTDTLPAEAVSSDSFSGRHLKPEEPSQSLLRPEPSPSDSFAQRLPTADEEEGTDNRLRMVLALSAGLVGASGVLLIGLLLIAVLHFSRQPTPAPLVPSPEVVEDPTDQVPQFPLPGDPVVPSEDVLGEEAPVAEVPVEEAPAEDVPPEDVPGEAEPEWPGQPIELEPDWPPYQQWPPTEPVDGQPSEPADPPPVIDDALTESDAPSPSGAQGSVVVQGAMDLRLKGASGTYGRGMVPAGSYQIEVTFDGMVWNDSGTISVADGQQVVLVCRANLKRCIAR